MEDLLQLQLLARQQRTPYAVATIVEATGSTPPPRAKCSSTRTAAAPGPSAADLPSCGRKRRRRCHPLRQKPPRALRSRAAGGGEAAWPAAGAAGVHRGVRHASAARRLRRRARGHVRAARGEAHGLREFWLFDDRPQEAVAEAAALADRFFPVAGDFYEGIAAQAVSPGAFFVICGHSHTQDGEALHAALEKDAALRRHARQPEKDRRAV